MKRIRNLQKGFVKPQDSLKMIIKSTGNFFEGFLENLRNLKKVQNSFQSSKPFLSFVVSVKPFLSSVRKFETFYEFRTEDETFLVRCGAIFFPVRSITEIISTTRNFCSKIFSIISSKNSSLWRYPIC